MNNTIFITHSDGYGKIHFSHVTQNMWKMIMSLITIQLVNNAIVLIKRTLEKHAKPKSVLKKKNILSV